MQPVPQRIVQITDTHLYADTEKELLGVNTQRSFQAILDLLKADPILPSRILLTGDLTQDGSEKAYLRLSEALSVLQVPVYCVPGNHDNSDVMASIYPRGMFSLQKQIIVDGWQFILLDSHKKGAVEGYLDQKELDFLSHCLASYPTLRAVIVFHHHPIPVGSVWLDKLGVTNAAEFWELLAKYPQVHTILFGHVHQLHEGEKNNIKYFSTPSTCIQFKANSPQFSLANIPPAYRIMDFYPNGNFVTTIQYAPHYVGRFLSDATGY